MCSMLPHLSWPDLVSVFPSLDRHWSAIGNDGRTSSRSRDGGPPSRTIIFKKEQHGNLVSWSRLCLRIVFLRASLLQDVGTIEATLTGSRWATLIARFQNWWRQTFATSSTRVRICRPVDGGVPPVACASQFASGGGSCHPHFGVCESPLACFAFLDFLLMFA